LTGSIVKSDAATLLIRTTVAGEISWLEIQELRSDVPLHVGLADGKAMVGKVTIHEGRLEVARDAGAVEAPKESVVALRDDEEQSAYARSQRRSLLYGWEGTVDAGFELTSGNSDTRNFRFASRASRKTHRDQLTLYAQSIYSVDELPTARPHITANQTAGQVGEEFKLKLGKNTSVIQNVAFFPDLTSSEGNYRVNLNFGTVTMIVKRLGWQNNFADTYVTNPPSGKKQNELVLTSGLRIAFLH
jgi:hypothetical protein